MAHFLGFGHLLDKLMLLFIGSLTRTDNLQQNTVYTGCWPIFYFIKLYHHFFKFLPKIIHFVSVHRLGIILFRIGKEKKKTTLDYAVIFLLPTTNDCFDVSAGGRPATVAANAASNNNNAWNNIEQFSVSFPHRSTDELFQLN